MGRSYVTHTTHIHHHCGDCHHGSRNSQIVIRGGTATDEDPTAKYPHCTAGKRACPPEDCGGPWGYDEFLVAISDPKHKEHDDLLEWVGGEFDPEKFDLSEVNQQLAAFR